jgi:hypothetical protein
VSVVSADVVKQSCAYVIFYRRRPMHDVEHRRAQITAAVLASAAAAQRAHAAITTAGRTSIRLPVSALDAGHNLVCYA